MLTGKIILFLPLKKKKGKFSLYYADRKYTHWLVVMYPNILAEFPRHILFQAENHYNMTIMFYHSFSLIIDIYWENLFSTFKQLWSTNTKVKEDLSWDYTPYFKSFALTA